MDLALKVMNWCTTGLMKQKNSLLPLSMAYGARWGCSSCFASSSVTNIEQSEDSDAVRAPRNVGEAAGGSDN